MLAIKNLLRNATGGYSYLEVGSFLGGSLTPFLMDASCTAVLSVDERERKQPDERGMNFDYAGVTHQTMIDGLKSHGIPTSKLQTFDGSMDVLESSGQTSTCLSSMASTPILHASETFFGRYL